VCACVQMITCQCPLATLVCWSALVHSGNHGYRLVVLQALEAEIQRLKQVEAIMKMDERKRPYSSLHEVKEPTEEEMEAFRMKRGREDDPMFAFLGQ